MQNIGEAIQTTYEFTAERLVWRVRSRLSLPFTSPSFAFPLGRSCLSFPFIDTGSQLERGVLFVRLRFQTDNVVTASFTDICVSLWALVHLEKMREPRPSSVA